MKYILFSFLILFFLSCETGKSDNSFKRSPAVADITTVLCAYNIKNNDIRPTIARRVMKDTFTVIGEKVNWYRDTFYTVPLVMKDSISRKDSIMWALANKDVIITDFNKTWK